MYFTYIFQISAPFFYGNKISFIKIKLKQRKLNELYKYMCLNFSFNFFYFLKLNFYAMNCEQKKSKLCKIFMWFYATVTYHCSGVFREREREKKLFKNIQRKIAIVWKFLYLRPDERQKRNNWWVTTYTIFSTKCWE